MFGIARLTIVAGLGLFLLAGPIAFQNSCDMSGCCCCPGEDAAETVFMSAGCCGCTVKEAPLPLQSAESYEVMPTVNDQSQLAAVPSRQGNFSLYLKFADRFSEINSHSPPSAKAPINSPLIC